MDKMIVTVFADQHRAYDACNALKDMHAQGLITIYSIAVVAQNRQGRTSLTPIPGEGPLGVSDVRPCLFCASRPKQPPERCRV